MHSAVVRSVSRSVVGLLAALLALTACRGADDRPSSSSPAESLSGSPTGAAVESVVEPPVLTPRMTWQWQLQGGIDTSHDVDVYDIDLFDAADEAMTELRGDGRIVICYFSTAYEDWRPDADAWPRAALGEPLDDWEGERWVDIRDAEARTVLTARLDLAVERGCDGVEPDNVTAYRNDSGFDLSARDQLDFNRYLAAEAHDRGLLIGLKNDLEQIPDLVDAFDFAINEQCVEYDECDAYSPFVEAGKPVFGAEYSDQAVGDPAAACATAAASGVNAVILPVELDGSFRVGC